MQKCLLAIAATLVAVTAANAQGRPLVIAATTSVEDSGLFEFLLPKFKERTGTPVRVVSRASAQALMSAERGTIDLVIVNDPGALDRFVDTGNGIRRHKVMFNEFVLVGPAADPAGVKGTKDAPAALRKIALLRAPFVSRGDESGTHVAEQHLWTAAGVNPKARSGHWYRESGLGMGATLDIAARLDSYLLVDRATWLAAKDRAGLEIVVEGDPLLFNQYEIILVNPAKHAHVDVPAATAFIDWIVSDEGQALIASYRVGGQQMFFPNAKGQN